MKHLSILACLLPALMLTACDKQAKQPATTEPDTKVYAYLDSTKLSIIDLKFEVPVGQDSLSAVIRDSVLTEFERQICPKDPYTGDQTDIQARFNYYVKYETDKLDEDYMIKHGIPLDGRDTISAVEWKTFTHLSLMRLVDTESYTVYGLDGLNSGGAHAYTYDPRTMTFDKRMGHIIDHLVCEDSAPEMQDLLWKGLLQYYNPVDKEAEDQLFDRLGKDENGDFRLPKYAIYPNAAGDSLLFIYARYEIGSGADYMPTFALPVSELMPYLTEEGRSLFEK